MGYVNPVREAVDFRMLVWRRQKELTPNVTGAAVFTWSPRAGKCKCLNANSKHSLP